MGDMRKLLAPPHVQTVDNHEKPMSDTGSLTGVTVLAKCQGRRAPSQSHSLNPISISTVFSPCSSLC
jgi:hypothetical protein